MYLTGTVPKIRACLSQSVVSSVTVGWEMAMSDNGFATGAFLLGALRTQ